MLSEFYKCEYNVRHFPKVLDSLGFIAYFEKSVFASKNVWTTLVL